MDQTEIKSKRKEKKKGFKGRGIKQLNPIAIFQTLPLFTYTTLQPPAAAVEGREKKNGKRRRKRGKSKRRRNHKIK